MWNRIADWFNEVFCNVIESEEGKTLEQNASRYAASSMVPAMDAVATNMIFN